MAKETTETEQAQADTTAQDETQEPEEPKAHGPSAKKKSRAEMFADFFGPECESEIDSDGHLIRGAEKFAVKARGSKAPEGNWVALMESDHAVLYKQRD